MPIRASGAIVRRIPNHGAEAYAYIRYILDEYDRLPDKILFMHAHTTSWHQQFNVLQRIVLEQPTAFCSMNTMSPRMEEPVHRFDAKLASSVHLWQTVFEPMGLPALPLYIEYPVGGQFVVSREAIYQYSRDQWQRMMVYLRDDRTFSDKEHAIGFQRLWKFIFTRTPLMDRQHDVCWLSSS